MARAQLGSKGSLVVLITAHEAYPAFEGLFLNAARKIELGFRIFDPTTKLHSDAARAVGETWIDLIVATLERGVAIDITLSDFDPIAGYDLHRGSWETVRILHAVNEMTRAGAAVLKVRCLQHPAEAGVIPRLLFAHSTRKKLREIAADIDERSGGAAPFKFIPRLRGALHHSAGRVKIRPWLLPKVYPVTLHLKMGVFDGHTTYIGGLDLNDRRFDDKNHNRSAQDTWHDVQLIVRDEAISKDALGFLRNLPATMAGDMPPAPITSGFRTTLSRAHRSNPFTFSPETVSDGLLREFQSQIDAARDFIYIETQYFRDRRIAKTLANAARRNPNLKFLLLLPAAPDDVAFHGSTSLDARFGEYLQTRAVRKVRKAFGDRFFVVSPVQPRASQAEESDEDRATLKDAPIVYVHAKIAIFDSVSAIVGSANLNGRSLKWDVEAGVVLTDPGQIESLRDAVFRHWLPVQAGPAFFTPDTAFQQWHHLAISNANRHPDDREGFVMPYDLDPAKAIGMPIPGAPEELV